MTNAAQNLLIVSGASGSGKTTIIERMRKHPQVRVSINVTTRPRRDGERDGRDYAFVSRECFEQMKADGLFVETNDVFTNGTLYGSLKSDLDAALARADELYIMEVDVVGARNIREAGYAGLHVFITAPSSEVLAKRLRERGTDDEAAIAKRLGRAEEERELADQVSATIVENDVVDHAVERILERVGLSALPS
jgi:guanylate kinase